ncbi:MAG: hypothetical protein BYD32DRAFT_428977 [Podila humilis]|nr:MAG: hypothetical protein BYD32DRAFT_428977 [Podila humilis]
MWPMGTALLFVVARLCQVQRGLPILHPQPSVNKSLLFSCSLSVVVVNLPNTFPVHHLIHADVESIDPSTQRQHTCTFSQGHISLSPSLSFERRMREKIR